MNQSELNDTVKVLNDLKECSFPYWFSSFEKIAIRGIPLPLPDYIVEYLCKETIILPKECYPFENAADNRNSTIIEFTTSGECALDNNEFDGDEDCCLAPEFPDFSRQIKTIIEQLGADRGAFVKTRWHCPKDAFWITAGHTLKIRDLTDVYQLLTASGIVKQDLRCGGLSENYVESRKLEESKICRLQPDKNAHSIVLKEWLEIHPGTEFRCFVRRRSLIAISPRDWPEYHESIVEQKHEICNDILTIFKENIKRQFALENFVFDIVRLSKDYVLLVDFSPFHKELTDSLGFSWEELEDENRFLEHDNPEFRYLPNDCGIQPSKRNNYGFPIDIIDMFSKTNTESNQNIDLTSMLVNSLQHNCEIQEKD